MDVISEGDTIIQHIKGSDDNVPRDDQSKVPGAGSTLQRRTGNHGFHGRK